MLINFSCIVLMRGERTPIARRGINLYRNQAVAIETGLQQTIDLARCIIAAPDLNGGFFRAFKISRMVFIGFTPTISYIQFVAFSSQLKFRISRKVEGMSNTAKNVFSSVYRFPVSFVCFCIDVGAAGDQRFDNFFVAFLGGIVQGRPAVLVPGVDIVAS